MVQDEVLAITEAQADEMQAGMAGAERLRAEDGVHVCGLCVGLDQA